MEHTRELVQGGPPSQQVRHGDVPRLHARRPDGGRHFPVTVAALLPDDGDLSLGSRGQLFLGRPPASNNPSRDMK